MLICVNYLICSGRENMYNLRYGSDMVDCVGSTTTAAAQQWRSIKGTPLEDHYVAEAKNRKKASAATLSCEGKVLFFKKKEKKIKELVCTV